jgi:hypothetical protein
MEDKKLAPLDVAPTSRAFHVVISLQPLWEPL